MSLSRPTGAPEAAAHVDTEALRREHPTAEVVASYGIELRRVGAALVGRCPFHNDRGRPNLHVYKSGRWICYRCGEHGDVIEFLQRIENLSFREAAARLTQGAAPAVTSFRKRRGGASRSTSRRTITRTDDEHQVLAAATELYANRLLNDERALRYLARRGFKRGVIERYRLGYSSGDELLPYLRWRRLPVAVATSIGLLRKDGSEFMAGRITVPEFRAARPIWLIGRILLDATGEETAPFGPKYLGLPGPKPLLGWEDAVRDTRGVVIVEGPLDLLTLRMWGVPGIALAGSDPSRANLALLDKFDRVYLALDQDEGGAEATERLASQLGRHVVRIGLPPGVKDVAELAQRDNGAEQFRRAIMRAVNSSLAKARLAA